VDVCSALDDGDPPVPLVLNSTVLVGADCNRYTVPLQVPLLVTDTSTVNLQVNPSVQQTLQADVIIAPGQLITNTTQGISLTCEQVQDCAFGITNNFFAYNDGANSVSFSPSADAGNLIGTGSDGRPFVAPSGLTVLDTDCLNLTLSGSQLSGAPVVSPAAGNTLVCNVDGLFVNLPAISVVGVDTDCAQVVVSEPTVNNFEVQAVPVISPAAGNQLVCTASGLYAAPAPLSGGAIGEADTGTVVNSGAVAAPAIFSSATAVLLISNPSAVRSAILTIYANIPTTALTAASAQFNVSTEVRHTFNLPAVSVVANARLSYWSQEATTAGGAEVGTSLGERSFSFIVPPGFVGNYQINTIVTVNTGNGALFVDVNGARFTLVTI
jgi:hypothetical protein